MEQMMTTGEQKLARGTNDDYKREQIFGPQNKSRLQGEQKLGYETNHDYKRGNKN
jgi:hypothetical protein